MDAASNTNPIPVTGLALSRNASRVSLPSNTMHSHKEAASTSADVGDVAYGKAPVAAAAPEAEPRIWNWSVFITVITIALSGATYGLENAIMSPLAAMPQFVDKYQGVNRETGTLTFTASHQSMLFSIPLIGTILGAILSSPLQNKFGRKWTLFSTYVFSIPATQLQLWAPNLAAFIAGRLLNGLAYGCALAIGPLYLADVVPAKIRGGAVASTNLLTIMANLLAAICCWSTERTYDDSRQYMVPLAVQAGLPLLLLAPTPFLPESPVWFVQKGRVDDARKSLRRVRPVSDAAIEHELEIIVRGEQERKDLAQDTHFTEIFSREHLMRTLVAGSFFALNQVSGIILSTTYATIFLEQVGVADPFVLTVYAYVCQLVAAALAIYALERVGRRALALPGFVILTIIDFVAGGLAFKSSDSAVAQTIAGLAMVFNFVWTLCFYSISLLMPSELPTQRLRSYTMSYAIGWGQTTAVVTTLAVPQITAADAANLGAKAYLIFGGCMACITVAAFFLLPETKGRTFVEVDELYEMRIPAWRWRKAVTSLDRQKAAVVVVANGGGSTTVAGDEQACFSSLAFSSSSSGEEKKKKREGTGETEVGVTSA